MNRFIFFFAAMLGLVACTPASEQSANSVVKADSGQLDDGGRNETIVRTLCFQRLAGTANQDTTSLKLNIEGEKVTGVFSHFPKEKDKRVGKITATKHGELIKGLWIYLQEGINDTLQLEFKLDGDKLLQKNYTINPETGREVFSKESDFSIVFARISCKD